MIAIWYPIKLERDASRWLESLAAEARATIRCWPPELWIHPRDSRVGLNGSGMAIVNPPYRLDERMRDWLPVLHRRLDPQGEGGWERASVSGWARAPDPSA